jgi:malonyl-CoA/methylmalonyl-CoA synthetase
VNSIALFERAEGHGSNPALLSDGRTYTYAELLSVSARLAHELLDGSQDLRETRIGFLIPSSFAYAASQWGIWRAGGITVPLSIQSTEPELEHVLTDAEVGGVLTTGRFKDRVAGLCGRLGIPSMTVDGLVEDLEPGNPSQAAGLPELAADRRAMILYTSGTTSKPKGVVTSHGNIEAQIRSLVEAWGWRPDDRIPLFLPLHHVHGIVNVLSCALWSGALAETFGTFDQGKILGRVAEGAFTVFMAVPTIYVKLIRAFEDATPDDREAWSQGFAAMRLMVSGSAALPASVHRTWTGLTGQKLLERYGMTEIGMGLSNPLEGERRPGSVGLPLPGVEVRLVEESGRVVEKEGVPGEIQVSGPTVFREYWRKPEVTQESFDGPWFKTGDMAVLEDGYYRILGRLSVDIIKSGGEKLSALEIEDVLRTHPSVRECAVVGVADELWGESVGAAVTTVGDGTLTLDELRSWAGSRLSRAKLPKKLLVVQDFPRNAMGKIMKPGVKALLDVE